MATQSRAYPATAAELLDDPAGITQGVVLATASPRVVFIDPTAAWGGDGTIGKPFNSWYAFTLRPGDVALQKGGTTSSGFTVTTHGTAANPVVIGSYGTGQARVSGTVVLDGASHVTVTGLDITGGNGFGVMLTGGTHDSVVQASSIHGGTAGVFVAGGASARNVISGNTVYENDVAGVWFDGTASAAGAETLVIGNQVYRNGQQGILLHGSNVTVDGNTVVNNGLSGLPGASGIHAYGLSPADAAGGHGLQITNNVVAYQRDGSSFDGNGILLDHWTGGNVVAGNTVFGNDGSGIGLYSSRDNLVLNNRVQGNVVDAGGSHEARSGEIFLGEASFAPGQTTGNTVAGNTAYSTSAQGLAAVVDASAAGSSNVIGVNSLGRSGDGPLWSWGSASGKSLDAWNAHTPDGASDWSASRAPVAALPGFSAAVLDTSFVPRSQTFLNKGVTATSVMVTFGAAKDLTGAPGANWLAGDARDNVLAGGNDVDFLAGGPGNDTLQGAGGDDLLFGGAGKDVIRGGDGEDTLDGGSGDDTLYGDLGADVLSGGPGNDVLIGGAGSNTLIGGPGRDTFALGRTSDYVVDFVRGEDKLDVSALGFRGMADLKLAGDASGGILNVGGSTYVLLTGVNPGQLSAADFVFAR